MRQSWVWIGIFAGLVQAWSVAGAGARGDEPAKAEHGEGGHGPKFKKYQYHLDHKKIEVDLANEDQTNTLIQGIRAGAVESAEGIPESINPMQIVYDLGL